MQQYLLNASAIWLISLVLFDAFLRKESYHNYNRFYLLFTFLLGALLPLWQWQNSQQLYTSTLVRPLQQIITTKQNIISATTVTSNTINWLQWATIIYLSGVLVAVCLLMIEIIKLAVAFRSPNRSQQDGWRVIETGKEHTPFSFMDTLFVCSKQQYSNDEWDMILMHEQRHTTLFHVADVLLMQMARIAFWFHPLVYLYNKRLLLVHEYQADSTARQQPALYGSFLIEQAILQSAPALSHSFNRSPIKNRILMLTYKSSVTARTKMLVFIPLLIVCFILFTKNSFSREEKGGIETITYKGNKFEIQKSTFRGMIKRVNPETQKEVEDSIFNDAIPLKMNGEKLFSYRDTTVTLPDFIGTEKIFWNYLLDPIKQELDKLADGSYYIRFNNVIVDANGKLVYYEFTCVYSLSGSGRIKNKHFEFNADITKGMEQFYDNAKIKPARLNGKAVPYFWAQMGGENIEVKNHKANF